MTSPLRRSRPPRFAARVKTPAPFALLRLVPFLLAAAAHGAVGVGAPPLAGAEVILDGSREMLDAKWTYWAGPRFASALPIKWKVVPDPVDRGTVVQTDDPNVPRGAVRRGGHRDEEVLPRFPPPRGILRDE